jgi:glutaredoxin
VRDYLTDHGIPFVERNIRSDQTARQELLDRTGELLVPVLFVGDQKILGWDQDGLNSALGIGAA